MEFYPGKQTTKTGAWMKERTVGRLAVVALATACWVALSCTYLCGEGPGENRAKVLRVALRGAD